MFRFLIRWGINAVALWAAIAILPGIDYQGDWIGIVLLALIFGFLNALLRPLLKLLTCPLILLTLGLFVLVINGLTLWLASAIAVNWFHVGFYVEDFWSAFLGALIVSVVTVVLSALVREGENDK